MPSAPRSLARLPRYRLQRKVLTRSVTVRVTEPPRLPLRSLGLPLSQGVSCTHGSWGITIVTRSDAARRAVSYHTPVKFASKSCQCADFVIPSSGGQRSPVGRDGSLARPQVSFDSPCPLIQVSRNGRREPGLGSLQCGAASKIASISRHGALWPHHFASYRVTGALNASKHVGL